MKRRSKIIMGTTLALLLNALGSTPALAQDFYNGCRGPRALQIDSYVSRSEGKTKGTLIAKLFTRNLRSSLSDLLLAAPFTVSERGEIDTKGFNIGYIADDESVSALGAIGLFKDGEGEYDVLSPQLYFTHIRGQWTFDFEGNLSIHLKSHEKSGSASITIGYGITESLRVGLSPTKETGADLKYRASARVELTKDHKYWVQAYVGENSVEFRFALNF